MRITKLKPPQLTAAFQHTTLIQGGVKDRHLCKDFTTSILHIQHLHKNHNFYRKNKTKKQKFPTNFKKKNSVFLFFFNNFKVFKTF